MLLFSCPNCGPRNETEFHYGGQAHVAYPDQPGELSDREWAEYLFYRQNTKGLFAERWVHSTGCRKWFNMIRDTVSYDIQAVYRMGEQPPEGLTAPPAAQAKSQPLAPAEANPTNTSEGV
ncbi:sarcosine oxidase subunit delta [Arthrobacter livingstonensis]|uniref:Sarcosine oxidase subunit delta n=1 Tax=Arthrobacter livingstonensis TaxID=670078 RepID=A0A2V5LMS8_9MICC|nr:sarcosine oxidase subunit delta [Arthrobacter livingstonensis]PYI69010.1 sarcosine oxidase subunit delta [Arthrobacter livingstonensis]